MKFATKFIRQCPLYLRHIATLPRQINNSNFSRYSADVEENANKLLSKSTDFNSSMHVTVHAECIYVFFLSKSCSRRWIPCWLLTNTAATSAVTNFRCHKLIAKVNKQKISDMEYFICNQYREQLAILNTENIKIFGWIIKLQPIKMRFVCISSTSAVYLQKIWSFNFPR